MGGSVAFCGLTPVLTKTFHIMRLNEATKISVTEDDAIAAVERTNPSSPGQTEEHIRLLKLFHEFFLKADQ